MVSITRNKRDPASRQPQKTKNVGRGTALMLVVPAFLCLHSLYLLASTATATNDHHDEDNVKAQEAHHIPHQSQNPLNTTRRATSLTARPSSDLAMEAALNARAPMDYRPLNHTPVAIFYNILTDDGMYKSPANTMANQLSVIGQSAAFENRSVSLYYDTIGIPPNHTLIMQLCEENHLDCHHVGHYESGDVTISQQSLYDFCQQHEEYRVIYADTQVRQRGKLWVKHLMQAVSHETCVRPPIDDCDVCGLLVIPWPTVNLPGNQFAARCSYVKKLIPPKDYRKSLWKVLTEARMQVIEGIMRANLFEAEAEAWGINTFAPGTWIASHPSVSLCDLSPVGQAKPWKVPGAAPPGGFVFAKFPRHDFDYEWQGVKPHLRDRIMTWDKPRVKEYFFLAGHVFRWYGLYNETAPPTSWYWEFFPDANFWKAQLKKFGRNTIKAISDKPVMYFHAALYGR
jgi:hypothetical protein